MVCVYISLHIYVLPIGCTNIICRKKEHTILELRNFELWIPIDQHFWSACKFCLGWAIEMDENKYLYRSCPKVAICDYWLWHFPFEFVWYEGKDGVSQRPTNRNKNPNLHCNSRTAVLSAQHTDWPAIQYGSSAWGRAGSGWRSCCKVIFIGKHPDALSHSGNQSSDPPDPSLHRH